MTKRELITALEQSRLADDAEVKFVGKNPFGWSFATGISKCGDVEVFYHPDFDKDAIAGSPAPSKGQPGPLRTIVGLFTNKPGRMS